jgi:large-conductance mechanosensitive channel
VSKRRVLFISTIVILLLLLLLELSLSKLVPDMDKISSFVSGVIIGVATGLLVTALASRIINLPLWAITILTSYAVIQLAFPILVYQKEPWQSKILPFVVVGAFLGKVFLLAIVHWARDTNRLLYYMARTRKIHDEENEQRYAQSFNEAISELEKGAY